MAKAPITNPAVDEAGETEEEGTTQTPYVVVDVSPVNMSYINERNQLDPIAVRRPAIGLSRHESRFTTIEVIARSDQSDAGTSISLINSSYSSGMGRGTANFFIESIAEQDADAATIVSTFSSWMVTANTPRPQLLSVTGVLLDSKNFQWRTEWRENYQRYLKADQCILRRAMVYLTYKNVIFEGYILNSTTQDAAQYSDVAVQLTFTMVVRRIIDLDLTSIETLSDTQLRQAVKGIVDPVVGSLKGAEDYTKEALDSLSWARAMEMVIPEEGWDGSNPLLDEVGLEDYNTFEHKVLVEDLERYGGRFNTRDLQRYLSLTSTGINDAGDTVVTGEAESVTNSGGKTNRELLQEVIESSEAMVSV